MANGLVVTITQPAGNKLNLSQRAECVEYADLLMRLCQKLITTNQASGTINDRNGLGNLTWVYTPIAPS